MSYSNILLGIKTLALYWMHECRGCRGGDLHDEIVKKGVILPAIFVTAEDNEQTRMKARALDAAGFIRKPIDWPALSDAIAWAMEMAGQPGRRTELRS